MDSTTILGLIAGAFTTIAFLPQVIRTWRLKSTRDISAGMLIIFSTGVLLWLIYGICINALPIIIANSAIFVLVFIILIFKVKYK